MAVISHVITLVGTFKAEDVTCWSIPFADTELIVIGTGITEVEVLSKPSTVTVAGTGALPLLSTYNEICAVVPVMVTNRSFAERFPLGGVEKEVNARDWTVKLFRFRLLFVTSPGPFVKSGPNESVVALLVKSIVTVQDVVPAVKEPPLKVNDGSPGKPRYL